MTQFHFFLFPKMDKKKLIVAELLLIVKNKKFQWQKFLLMMTTGQISIPWKDSSGFQNNVCS